MATGDGEAAGVGRVVGADRAADPEGQAALPLPRSEANRRPERADGDLVCLSDGDPLGVPAEGDGLRLGMTCWRRLHEWQPAGVWQRLHELLLAKLNEADRIDWSRAAIDSSYVRAFAGRQDRPEPGR